jgi:SNF2 family DNA or RNA helicase
MNVVVYHDAEGGAEGREVIRNKEFYFDERTRRMGIFKFNVLITSNSVVLKDWQHFEKIRWRYVVVDEAHSLKNKDSQFSSALKVQATRAFHFSSGGHLWCF